ncbi:hypothetical protein [Acinetobacter sp. ANC 5054]|uniref:hypothetical protein n=1 Tax=Acinetobacter sp. ANC 5054 TaxID=1977877 RepID=UPI001D1708A9|nr:hypothetical protein [Acinetobacter sp. ANC 5054]
MSKIFNLPAKFSALFLCFSLLTACQQQPEPQPAPEFQNKQTVQKEAVDLSLLCKKLAQNMQEIDDQRTTFALEQINQDLKVCLPLLEAPEQQKLLKLSNQMYKNFLHVERTAQQQLAFEQYAFDMAQHPTIQQNHYEQLTLRDQYLLKHKGQAYVELFDAGEGQLRYRRSPEYLAKIFAPYMDDAEQVFIENLAEQNTQPVLLQKTLTLDPQDIASRALFWEDYLKQYPDSPYKKDAQQLLYQYSQFLFVGTSDSPVSGDYSDRLSIQASSLEEIEKLSKLKQSQLAIHSRQFLKLIEQNTVSGNRTAESQLLSTIGIHNPSPSYKKDCFSDAICTVS